MRHFGIHGHHGPYVPPYAKPATPDEQRARIRRRSRNRIIALNIVFWGCAIAAALIGRMPQ